MYFLANSLTDQIRMLLLTILIIIMVLFIATIYIYETLHPLVKNISLPPDIGGGKIMKNPCETFQSCLFYILNNGILFYFILSSYLFSKV